MALHKGKKGKQQDRPLRGRDWYSDHEPQEDGTMDAQVLVDEASEDSFPASDPPSYMTSIIPGAPRRRS